MIRHTFSRSQSIHVDARRQAVLQTNAPFTSRDLHTAAIQSELQHTSSCCSAIDDGYDLMVLIIIGIVLFGRQKALFSAGERCNFVHLKIKENKASANLCQAI